MTSELVGERHKDWDKYIGQYAYALHTAIHDLNGKTAAELFLVRKLITPFESMFSCQKHLSERLKMDTENIALQKPQELQQ